MIPPPIPAGWKATLPQEQRENLWDTMDENMRDAIIEALADAAKEDGAARMVTGPTKADAERLLNIAAIKEIVDNDANLKARAEQLLRLSATVPLAASSLFAELGVNPLSPVGGTCPNLL
jgi:hypothetical protein